MDRLPPSARKYVSCVVSNTVAHIVSQPSLGLELWPLKFLWTDDQIQQFILTIAFGQ